MTVTPKRQSRREPIEKEHISKNGVIKITDQKKLSGMSPVWMHDQSFGIGKPGPSRPRVELKGVPANCLLRKEGHRLMLQEPNN